MILIPDKRIKLDQSSTLTETAHLEPMQNSDTCPCSNDDGNIRYDLEDFDFISSLGKGGFGSVKLVRSKKRYQEKIDLQLFAIKSVRKTARSCKTREKEIMSELNHPFIVKFHYSMEDDTYIHFVLESLTGGNLHSHIEHLGRFPENNSRFYGACITLALSKIHELKIAYRDLKPENLVIDSNGYLKIVDFGTAKKLESGEKTFTYCGTLSYMAPEILLQKGHNWAVDYWSLGIVLFEMTAGYQPFNGSDRIEMQQNVVYDEINFPSHFSEELIDLLKKLLRKFPSRRIGMREKGIEDIVKHAWFSKFDWVSLLSMELNVPKQPI